MFYETILCIYETILCAATESFSLWISTPMILRLNVRSCSSSILSFAIIFQLVNWEFGKAATRGTEALGPQLC